MNIMVIGLGSMGIRRIRLIRELKIPADIIGVDSRPERCDAARARFGVTCCVTVEEARQRGEISCAFICTSPLSHAKLIWLCLSYGYHVFTEINLVSDRYTENINLAREKGLTLFLSSTPLYKSEMCYIDKRLKESGKQCIYQYHVGQYLPDWHPWDNLQDFFVSDRKTNGCREILGIELPWMQNTFGKIKRIHVWKRKLLDLPLDFPDTYMIQIAHENGNAGSLIVDVVSRQAVRHLEVLNGDIYIKWNGRPDTLYERNVETRELEPVNPGNYTHEKGYGEFINEYAYRKEIEEFFEVIRGKKPRYTFEQDMETLEIIDRMERGEDEDE